MNRRDTIEKETEEEPRVKTVEEAAQILRISRASAILFTARHVRPGKTRLRVCVYG